MTVPAATDRREDRIVLVQAHASALGLLGTLCFVVSASRLTQVPGPWGTWRGCLLVAAGLAAAAAVLPWLTASFTVRAQRLVLAGAVVAGTVGITGGAWAVDLLAVLGVQLVVAGQVLSELGGQRRAIWWFWVSVIVLVVATGGYHLLVDVQPRPE